MGDRVETVAGKATVLHDELEDFDTEGDPGQRADQALFYQSTIIVNLDETNDDYPDPGQDVHLSRAYVSPLKQ